MRSVSDPLGQSAYESAVARHAVDTAPQLDHLEVEIALAESGGDPATADRLRTTRTLLLSGLFDADFYLRANPDVQQAGVDPLRHYVAHGDAEGRSPNALFSPTYYRRHAAGAVPPYANALEHYLNEGERSGLRPHAAFDPRAYLEVNSALVSFVDRPLFHFLKIGQQAGLPIARAEASAVTALPAFIHLEQF